MTDKETTMITLKEAKEKFPYLRDAPKGLILGDTIHVPNKNKDTYLVIE